MAITKSAKRAFKKSLKRREKNLRHKTEIKKILKKERDLIFEKKFEEAKSLLPKVYKTLDKAVKARAMKKGRADRIKSRVSKSISKSQKPTNRAQHRA